MPEPRFESVLLIPTRFFKQTNSFRSTQPRVWRTTTSEIREYEWVRSASEHLEASKSLPCKHIGWLSTSSVIVWVIRLESWSISLWFFLCLLWVMTRRDVAVVILDLLSTQTTGQEKRNSCDLVLAQRNKEELPQMLRANLSASQVSEQSHACCWSSHWGAWLCTWNIRIGVGLTLPEPDEAEGITGDLNEMAGLWRKGREIGAVGTPQWLLQRGCVLVLELLIIPSIQKPTFWKG